MRNHQQRTRFGYDRVKRYPIIWRAFKKAFVELSGLSTKRPMKWGKEEAGRRTEGEEEFFRSYKAIILFMRKQYGKQSRYKEATDWDFWRLGYRNAFILANELDDDYTLWSRLGWEEREFFRAFTKLIEAAAKQANAHYESDFAFTAGQFGCILRCVRSGGRTPGCAR